MRITTMCRGLTFTFALAGSALVGAANADAVARAQNDNVPVIRVFGTQPVLAAEVHGQLGHYEVPGEVLQVAPPARFEALDAVAVR